MDILTARSAASSCSTGSLKKAMIPSPVKRSSVAPYRYTSAPMAW